MKFTFYNDAFIIGHKRRLYYEHDFSKEINRKLKDLCAGKSPKIHTILVPTVTIIDRKSVV